MTIVFLFLIISCSDNNIKVGKENKEKTIEKLNIAQTRPHEYGGWYCPDNLKGFPAVDIDSWKNIPVVNGRFPTKEETKNGTSLIFVDTEKYSNAKVLDIKLPKLARYYNINSKKKELVIVIQAINFSNDSIVGFRYLNGGNGSARLNEVKFLSDIEIDSLSSSRFVKLNITINAPKDEIWNVLTKPKYRNTLLSIFNDENKVKKDLDNTSKVNFQSNNRSEITSEFAEDLYGNYYIQIDYLQGKYQHVAKFLLLENKQTKNTVLQIVCGPYQRDFKDQKILLNNWAHKVKELSEINNKK